MSPEHENARAHGDADDRLELDRFVPYRLAVLADWVSRSLARTYQHRFGITIPEWRILANLAREEPLSAGELSERANLEKPRVSRALQRMTRVGLIDREPSVADQRVAVIRMSGKGRDLYRQIEPLALSWEQEMLSGLSGAERIALDQLLDRLGEQLERMHGRNTG
ncbi:MarR family transcriptional regulator [Ectothiorhodospiraceae bacterium WFHF3C12]|nr:MarR family transcriptional regulator [Ectothiorhodospiraceae bacterium WFHF3C12]